jgi:hypothetical protein
MSRVQFQPEEVSALACFLAGTPEVTLPGCEFRGEATLMTGAHQTVRCRTREGSATVSFCATAFT